MESPLKYFAPSLQSLVRVQAERYWKSNRRKRARNPLLHQQSGSPGSAPVFSSTPIFLAVRFAGFSTTWRTHAASPTPDDLPPHG